MRLDRLLQVGTLVLLFLMLLIVIHLGPVADAIWAWFMAGICISCLVRAHHYWQRTMILLRDREESQQ